MNYPNLFILGAPKCGTTTLYYWLAQHIAIGAPHAKEPHYYYTPYGNQITHEAYMAIFEELEGDFQYYVDASVWHLFSESAAAKIFHDVPEAKFIVCLRNPVELAPSLHFQKLFSGHETISDFAQAWELNDTRAAGRFDGISGLPINADPRHMAYRDACLLGHQIRTLLRQVPKSKVFFCFLEDMSNNPQLLYEELCTFLELVPVQIEFSIKNRAKMLRLSWLRTALEKIKKAKNVLGMKQKTNALAWLHKLNRTEMRYQDPDEKLSAELILSFAKDIELIQAITERDLSHWSQNITSARGG